MAAIGKLQTVFPQYSSAYLSAILTQHNGALDLAVAAVLAQSTGDLQPLKVVAAGAHSKSGRLHGLLALPHNTWT